MLPGVSNAIVSLPGLYLPSAPRVFWLLRPRRCAPFRAVIALSRGPPPPSPFPVSGWLRTAGHLWLGSARSVYPPLAGALASGALRLRLRSAPGGLPSSPPRPGAALWGSDVCTPARNGETRGSKGGSAPPPGTSLPAVGVARAADYRVTPNAIIGGIAGPTPGARRTRTGRAPALCSPGAPPCAGIRFFIRQVAPPRPIQAQKKTRVWLGSPKR